MASLFSAFHNRTGERILFPSTTRTFSQKSNRARHAAASDFNLAIVCTSGRRQRVRLIRFIAARSVGISALKAARSSTVTGSGRAKGSLPSDSRNPTTRLLSSEHRMLKSTATYGASPVASIFQRLAAGRPTPPPEEKAKPDHAQRMLDFLQRWPKPIVSARDIQNYGPRPKQSREDVLKSVEILVRHGWLVSDPTYRRNGYQWQIVKKPPIVHPRVDS